MDKIELRAAADRLMYENSHNTTDYNMLIEYIDHSEAIKPDKDWISVKDRLPEPRECVLICTKSGVVDTDVYQEMMMPQTYFNYYNELVTHWMPLPEPPKED